MFINRLNEKDRDAVFDFFGSYSRFEFCLKAAGFGIPDKYGGISIDWKKAKAALTKGGQKSNLKPADLYKAGKYLWSHPPRKQIIKDGRPAWGKEEPAIAEEDATATKAVELIKRVRNNLFHGGKLWHMEPTSLERDVKLITAASKTLRVIVSLDRDVQVHFFG